MFENVVVVVSGEGGEGAIGGGADTSDVISGGGEMGKDEPVGEKEKGGSPSGEVGANNVGVIGGVEDIPRGAAEGNSGEEYNVGGGDSAGGDGEYNGGGDSSVGGGFGGGEDDNGAPNITNFRPVPLITRRRLREILAHAEGECIMLVCILCVCRRWTVLRVLGFVLSPR